MMRVAIIGNGRSVVDISSDIDSYDEIIRFNNFEYVPNIGTKTTIWILNSGKFMHHDYRDYIDRHVNSQIIVYLPFYLYIQKHVKDYIDSKIYDFRRESKLSKIRLCTEEESSFIYKYFPEFHKVTKKTNAVRKLGDQTFDVYKNSPSAGIFAILYAFEKYKCHIDIYGCDSLVTGNMKDKHHYMKNSKDNGKGHAWNHEKRIIEVLVKQGIVKIMLNDAVV